MAVENIEISSGNEPKRRKTLAPEGFVAVSVAAKLIGHSTALLLREGNAMGDIEFRSVRRASLNGNRVRIFINKEHVDLLGKRLNSSYTPKPQKKPA